MGNQECTVAREGPTCFKDLPQRNWAPWEAGPKSQPYETAEEGALSSGSTREAPGDQGLSVELAVEARQYSGESRNWEEQPELAGREIETDPEMERYRENVGGAEELAESEDPAEKRGMMTISSGLTEAIESGRLPRTYFDNDLGEAPLLDDDSSEPEEARHTFRSGAVYEGEWLGGMRHGFGQQTWTDGTEYIGQWHRGRASGLGQIKHSDGDVYTGQWVNGRAHGKGVYRFQDGAARYEGEFRCDHRFGMGVETWVDGSCYAGSFKHGSKHEYGVNTWPDGTVYWGHWDANELLGPGRYVVHDGPTFRGQWLNSMPHGMGQYAWTNGKVYSGRYRCDKKDGFGVLLEPDGSVQQGYWKMGEIQHS